MAGFKVTNEDGKELELLVAKPTHKEMAEADRARVACMARLIKSGDNSLLSKLQLEEFLRKQGLWTQEDEDKIYRLNSEIDELWRKIDRGGIRLKEGRELALAISDKRIAVAEALLKRQVYDETTLEARAEDERIDYLIYACTKNVTTGERHFGSLEEVIETKGSEIYQRAQSGLYEHLYGTTSQFEKFLPENRWLMKYKFLNENLEFVDPKTGKRVRRNWEPIESETTMDVELTPQEPYLNDETGQPIVEAEASVTAS